MNNSKLFKIVITISGIFFAYFIFSQNIAPQVNTNTAEMLISSPPGPVPSKETYEKILPKTDNPANVSYIERKFAGVLASFVETPAGREYINNLLKGQNQNALIFDMESYLKHPNVEENKIVQQGKGEVVYCGDTIEVKERKSGFSYYVSVGENKLLQDGLDSVFSFAKIGDLRKIKYRTEAIDIIDYEFEILKKAAYYIPHDTNYYTLKFGDKMLYCGSQASATIKVVDNKKKNFFSKDKVSFSLNNKSLTGTMMVAILNINLGGRGIIILQNDEFKKLKHKDDILKHIPDTKSPYIVVEIVL